MPEPKQIDLRLAINARSGTPIRFTFASQKLPAGATVVITEGALKADTMVRFRPKAHVIATS